MAKHFFTPQQEEAILNAIKHAENQTNGEIRVHVEAYCHGNDAYKRAVEVFEKLGMTDTSQKNGILFYLAYKDHLFSIIGDTGIHSLVTDAFWMELKMRLEENFKKGQFTEGLVEAINLSGIKLKQYFPKTADNTNELPNDISFG
ncbi:MAG: TPM domain-containing protein [Bacteroidia bacterium]